MKRILAVALLVSIGISAHADPAKRSGYSYAEPETRSIQDDDFANPGMLWVETGEKAWATADGESGKSCQSCHGAADGMKGVATHYPKFAASAGKVIDMEQRINLCRENGMKAKPYKWESQELLGLTAFLKMQSRGMPVSVSIDGPAAPLPCQGQGRVLSAARPA